MKQVIKQKIDRINIGEVPEGYKKTKFGIFPSEWEAKKLSEIMYIIKEKAGNQRLETLSITAGKGFVNQAEKFGKEMSGAQYVNYTVLKKGDFSYNKGNSKRYPQGCIYILEDREKAAVPNVFNSFRCGANAFSGYYKQLFIKGFLNYQLYRYINSGIRNDGLLNLYDEDFYGCKLPLPKLAEQEKIAEILTTWDNAIDLKEKYIKELEKRKKGLMQKLLTGKIRLKGFVGEWKKVELGEIFDYIQPTPYLVSSTDYSDKHKIPVLTAGKTFILGYTDETDGIFNNTPVVIFDDFTTASKYVDFPFKAKSSAMKILKCKSGYNIIFAYAAMQEINYDVGGHERHWISKFALLPIKVPCLEEQTAIANILSLADLEISMQNAELETSKLQKKGLMQVLLTGKVRV